MAVQSALYNIDGTTRTFPTSKHIPTKQHAAVRFKNVLDGLWVYIEPVQWNLINNSIVFVNAPDPIIYSQIEIRVADNFDELETALSDISTLAQYTADIAQIVDNLPAIIAAGNGVYLVNGLPTTASIGDIAVNTIDGGVYEWKIVPPATTPSWVLIAQSAGTSSGTANAVIPIVDVLPTTITAGSMVFNTPDGLFYAYINGAWETVVSPPQGTDVVGIEVYTANPTVGNYEGRVIFNSTLKQLLEYNAGVWVQVVEPTGAAATVADGSITTAKFATGLRPVEVVDILPTTGNSIGRMAMLTTDGLLYRYTATGWSIDVPTTALTGTITSTQIGANQISTGNLAVGAVTADTIAANAITSDKITANSITTAMIQVGAIGASQIATDAITATKVAAGAITASKIAALSIDATKIVAGTISADKMAANSITAGSIAAGAVTTSHLAANSVTASQISAGSVTATKIASGSITADKLTVDALDGKSAAFTGSRVYAATGAWTATFGNTLVGAANGGVHSEGYGYGVVGKASSGIGVFGYSLSGTGVKGLGTSWGVFGDTSDTAGQWGLITYQKAYAGGGFFPFTGSHIVYSKDTSLEEGMIVSCDDGFVVNIDQTLMYVSKASSIKDKKVVGVVSYVKTTLLDNISNNPIITPDHSKYIDYMSANKFVEVAINSVGEGGILVSNENGNIAKGDYITSDRCGYGMKQDDDLLHNYTVAKALESVDWAKETETTKMIACTYHCG